MSKMLVATESSLASALADLNRHLKRNVRNDGRIEDTLEKMINAAIRTVDSSCRSGVRSPPPAVEEEMRIWQARVVLVVRRGV
jgi:hypothetical protein